MKFPAIPAPPVCRRAWVAHLKRQGATRKEIAMALRIDELTVARLLKSGHPHSPGLRP